MEDVIQIPADQSNPGYDVLGNELTNPGGFVHNGGQYSLVTAAGTNTYADLISWGPTTNGVIENVLVYTNAPANTNLLNTWSLQNSSVWTNTGGTP